MEKIKIGLQMHAVREDFENKPFETLKQIKKMGYDGVEFNYSALKLEAKEYKEMLDECGLLCFGVLADWDNLSLKNLEKTISDTMILGSSILIVGSVPENVLTSDESAPYKSVEYLNTLYNILSERGIHTGYHNHDTDFMINVDGMSFFEYVMQNTPEEFMAVIDTGNAAAGGADVHKLYEKYSHRAKTIHIKGYSDSKKYLTPVWEADFGLDILTEKIATEGDVQIMDIEFGARGGYDPLERAGKSFEWLSGKIVPEKNDMRVGTLVNLTSDPYECIRHVVCDLGFKSGQLSVWDMTLYNDKNAEEILRAIDDFGFEPTALWCGWSGPHDWKYPGMYLTIGLVPSEWRSKRVEDILIGARFARKIGIKDIITHAGYMPDNPFNADRLGVMHAIRYICREIAPYGQRFLFETGEMIPVTLTQLIKDIGEDNIGINFDCANLIINNRGNSADALKLLAPFVCGVHAKDAVYPVGMNPKGKEVIVGDGDADFPEIIRILKNSGFKGDLTIEREIEDVEQCEKDIVITKAYLENLIESTEEDKND